MIYLIFQLALFSYILSVGCPFDLLSAKSQVVKLKN